MSSQLEKADADDCSTMASADSEGTLRSSLVLKYSIYAVSCDSFKIRREYALWKSYVLSLHLSTNGDILLPMWFPENAFLILSAISGLDITSSSQSILNFLILA
ncbi:hypothetical protein BaOVIS_020720 [Babesia ovis]|uniref:Uncharacterized protein n=1 Tax=Babesia ovis TaxID=5869 RepID=A0A9W5TBB2_BABOV|nr:hypothetical protein BaOVIS_020720 [Babesia ovis]